MSDYANKLAFFGEPDELRALIPHLKTLGYREHPNEYMMVYRPQDMLCTNEQGFYFWNFRNDIRNDIREMARSSGYIVLEATQLLLIQALARQRANGPFQPGEYITPRKAETTNLWVVETMPGMREYDQHRYAAAAEGMVCRPLGRKSDSWQFQQHFRRATAQEIIQHSHGQLQETPVAHWQWSEEEWKETFQ